MKGLSEQWYSDGWLSRLLAPLGGMYCRVMRARRALYRRGLMEAERLPVPVVVVGNLTVGGTGKTPLVMALAARLRELGRHPGVVSRGYGRKGQDVRAVSEGGKRLLNVAECGDEPALMADRLGVPVVVGRDRAEAVRRAAALGCDCVVADDGFQRLSLARDRAFVVVDGDRGFGNARCLPAGPLREPVTALADADAVVAAGAPPLSQSVRRDETGPRHAQGGPSGWEPAMGMVLEPDGLRGIRTKDRSPDLEWLQGLRVHAVAGIGAPERFFAILRRLGAEIVPHPFPDHHDYAPADLRFQEGAPLVTTEKDAVKLAEVGIDGWALQVSARLDPEPDGWLTDLPPAQAGGVY
ncbi:tetraacyldisaccharide 4'-kinase [Thiohalorhabdus sp.]|uniref:tetraacyldisaccharide 4'-kinase n=1 Tax=Thiohalorhabdus sp. TaxID=3094134 RepID=UPI002FC33D72